MFVTVIHRIHDPEGFQAAEVKALEAGLPSSVALPIHAATSDHALGICIWEGESVEAVRKVAEGAVGPYAKNEYSEIHVDGLTPQLANQRPAPADRSGPECLLSCPYRVTEGVGRLAIFVLKGGSGSPKCRNIHPVSGWSTGSTLNREEIAT
jgi:hypothetical protein